MHFGIITPPVPGHLHPFGALGRELISRGHRVTLFHMRDLEERVRDEQLEFVPVGVADVPIGALKESLSKLGKLDGLAALRFTIGEVRKTTGMMLRDAPAAMKAAGIEALLVDQTEPAGATIAELLGIPFITVCNALMLNREAGVPPAFSAWKLGSGICSRLRNQAGYTLSELALRPVANVVAHYRRRWGLPALRSAADTLSRLAQISQQPPAFEYPRQELPVTFHYVGPLRRPGNKVIPFPWQKLDGKPLVYASLGTLQNGKEQVFRTFAEACVGLNVQLVMTHGGGLDASIDFPGNPIVVSYAPQLEVLQKASLTLTHAGLNTVLDSLSYGVPLVAVPITYEQPAIAQRVRWCGAGQAIAYKALSKERVRAAIQAVLGDPNYASNAQRVQRSIREAGGVARAADVIEQVL